MVKRRNADWNKEAVIEIKRTSGIHLELKLKTEKIAMFVITNQILGRTFLTTWRLCMNCFKNLGNRILNRRIIENQFFMLEKRLRKFCKEVWNLSNYLRWYKSSELTSPAIA